MTAPDTVDNVTLPEPESQPQPQSRARTTARRVAKVVLALGVGYYAACIVLLVAYRFATPPITGVQLQRHVEALVSRDSYTIKKQFVPSARLPEHVSHAVVAAEDGRFYKHNGFDVTEMRAAGMDLLDGEIPRGASTITQQLVKNLFAVTTRNPVRKLFDASLTPPAELILGKERVLELYLNTAEWGPGVFGIEAAAKHHYGTSARHLTRSQAAALAALLPNPLRRTPANTAEYRGEILRRMAVRGW